MISNRFFSQLTAVAALALTGTFASAGPVSGNGVGLSAPTTLITFDEFVLPQDTVVTNQYASLGVTFGPGLHYSPYDEDEPNYASFIDNNFLGNYPTGQFPALLSAFTLSFSAAHGSAVFGLAANGSYFTFNAMLGGQLVDTFTALVDGAAYYGFTGETFDSITVTSLGSPYLEGYPDSFDFDNLQFDAAVSLPPATSGISPNATVPEPELGALFGVGLLGALVMRRRSARNKAA